MKNQELVLEDVKKVFELLGDFNLPLTALPIGTKFKISFNANGVSMAKLKEDTLGKISVSLKGPVSTSMNIFRFNYLRVDATDKITTKDGVAIFKEDGAKVDSVNSLYGKNIINVKQFVTSKAPTYDITKKSLKVVGHVSVVNELRPTEKKLMQKFYSKYPDFKAATVDLDDFSDPAVRRKYKVAQTDLYMSDPVDGALEDTANYQMVPVVQIVD